MSESYSVEAVLSARDASFTSGMQKATNSARNLEKTSSSVGKTIRNSFAFGVVMRAGQKAFDLTARGAAGLAAELSSSSATWKTFEGNMKNFGKSSKTITKVRGDLQKFATETIYSASDMASTYSQLAAVGTKNTTSLVKAFGGLAAAAENPQQAMKTLSQQATQMAAKPTVQWMDFKLMLEQTPAGIAAVAGAMGKSTSQLIKDVQDGKVKTEDFFKAMRKAAGEGTKFNKMATEYKTMGQAMDGLTETLTTKLQPAYDKLSSYGIKAIERMSSVLDKIDGDKLAKSLGSGMDKAAVFMEKAFSRLAPIAASAGKTLYEVGKATFDVGRAVASNKGLMDGLTTAFKTLGAGTQKASSFISEHQDIIGKLAPVVLGAVLAFKKFSKVSALLGKTPLMAGGGGGIAGVFAKINPAAVLSFAGAVAVLVGALIALSAARDMVIPFLEGLAGVVGKVATAILPLVQGTIQALAQGFATIAPAAGTLASAFASLSPLVSAFGVAISQVVVAVGQAVATILPALAPVITAIGQAIATIIPALAPVITALGAAISQIVDSVSSGISKMVTALTPIVSIVGNVITQVISILAPYIPNIQAMVEATMTAINNICTAFSTLVTNLSGIIGSIGGLITTFGNTVNSVLTTFGNTVSTILGSAGNLFTTFGNTVQTIMTSISTVVTSVGDSIRTVLDGIAGIFDSMGNAALHAGQGVQAMALGISILVGLPLGDLAGTLAATATGLGAIATQGAGLEPIGAAMAALGTTILILATQTSTAVTMFGTFVGAVTGIAGSLAPASAGVSSFASAVASLIGPMSTAAQPMVMFASSAKIAATAATVLAAGMVKSAAALSMMGAGASRAAKGLVSIASAGKSVQISLAGAAKTGMAALTKIGKAFSIIGKTGQKSGKQVGDGFSKNLQTGLKKGLTVAQTTGRQIGQKFVTSLKPFISQSGNVAGQMTSNIGSKLRAGHGAAYSAGAYVGRGVASGLRSALGSVRSAANSIISQVNRAMRAKAKIHSPSKLTNKKVGQPLAQGVAKGLSKGGKKVKEESKKLIKKNILTKNTGKMKKLVTAGKKYAKNAAASAKRLTSASAGGYENAGTKISKSIKTNLEKRSKAALKSAKTTTQKWTDKYYGTDKTNKKLDKNKETIKKLQLANKTASKAQKKANQKRITALQKQNLKLTKKTKSAQNKSNKMSKTVYAQFEKYMKTETDKLVAAADKSIEKITTKYQEMYDAVISKRTNFYNKLSDVGDLFTSDDYGYIALKDFNKATAQIKEYSANLERLKGVLPDGYMEEILGLDTATGLKLTNQLLKMSTDQLKAYGQQYSTFINTASQTSSKYYQPQLDAIKTAFNSAIDAEMKTLQVKMDALGQSAVQSFCDGIAKKSKTLAKAASSIGKATNTGYAKGNKKSSKKSTKATKKTSKKNISTAKKKYKVHSPSKVFAWIGEMTGVGYAKGLESTRRMIRNVSESTIHIPNPGAPSATSSGSALNDKYSYGSSIYEITVISELDGRQVGKSTAPFVESEIAKKNTRESRKNGLRPGGSYV